MIIHKLGWGDASIDKVLVMQAQGPSIHIKSQEWGVRSCNLNTGEAKDRWSSLVSQPGPVSELQAN